jgi:transposase
VRADQDLIPEGLRAESMSIQRGRVDISVAPSARSAECPMCGRCSRRVHSTYLRKIADLPRHGTPVVFSARARRFFCDEASCERKIFCERLPDVAAHARKTSRLDDALLLVAFELGGRAGAHLAAELGLLVSRATLLRRLRRCPTPAVGKVRVLGVDDWAARRGERYGTVLVDLERRRVVDLLPERSAEALSAWLEAHGREVELISRDRYRPYIEGASAGAPDAVQVADRFHVFKNLYDAVEKAVERNRRAAARAARAPSSPPADPGAGHPLWGHRADPAKREERLMRYERVVELRRRGVYVEDIASEVGLTQRTVVAWLNAGGFPERGRPKRKKPSPVAPYADYLYRRWQERCINMAQLYREIKGMGYEGSYDAVADHMRCLRKGLVPPASAPAGPAGGSGGRTKGTRHESQEIARLLMLEAKAPEALKHGQSRYLEGLRASSPELAAAQDLAGRFAKLMREDEEGGLAGWLREAVEGSIPEMRAFARGILQDEVAVRAAIREPWSNGQVEGQVNRLKMLKRQMYGRANFDLLRRRVLGAA